MSEKTILGSKLDMIAAIIADETILNKTELSLTEKCAVLKTLDAHYAVVHKVEPPEQDGGAFAKYRTTISATSNLGTRNSGDAESGRNTDSDGPESGSDLDLTGPLELD